MLRTEKKSSYFGFVVEGQDMEQGEILLRNKMKGTLINATMKYQQKFDLQKLDKMFKLSNKIESIDSQINLKLSSHKLYPIMANQLIPNIGIISMSLLPLSQNHSESQNTFDFTQNKLNVNVRFHIYDLLFCMKFY